MVAQGPIARASRRVVVAQSSAAAAPAPAEESGNNTKIILYIILWYVSNIIFNIVNKQSLNVFPCPWFISTLQLAASGLIMIVAWITGLQPKPVIDRGFMLALMPVALFHTVGHVAACTSFSQVAVSFTHVIKSAEPVFSVALSGPLLGATYPLYVWLSLVPIVAGCAMSAMKEVSFAWSGFNNAMLSNLGMVLRNIYSKKSLVDYKHIDGINLYGLISIASLVYCAPAAFIMERSMWASAWEAGVTKLGGTTEFVQLLAVACAFYHLYNQASYMVLDQGISPVTFSVGNTMKRVAVVVSSVMFFRNPVSIFNWIGTSVAIAGTYIYSLASDKWAAEQKAAKAAAAK